MVGQARRVAPAIHHTEAARAVGLRFRARLDRTAIALALFEPHHRTVLAGHDGIDGIDRAALHHRDAAHAERDAAGGQLLGGRRAAGQQQKQKQKGQQGQTGARHRPSVRRTGKPMVSGGRNNRDEFRPGRSHGWPGCPRAIPGGQFRGAEIPGAMPAAGTAASVGGSGRRRGTQASE